MLCASFSTQMTHIPPALVFSFHIAGVLCGFNFGLYHVLYNKLYSKLSAVYTLQELKCICLQSNVLGENQQDKNLYKNVNELEKANKEIDLSVNIGYSKV